MDSDQQSSATSIIKFIIRTLSRVAQIEYNRNGDEKQWRRCVEVLYQGAKTDVLRFESNEQNSLNFFIKDERLQKTDTVDVENGRAHYSNMESSPPNCPPLLQDDKAATISVCNEQPETDFSYINEFWDSVCLMDGIKLEFEDECVDRLKILPRILLILLMTYRESKANITHLPIGASPDGSITGPVSHLNRSQRTRNSDHHKTVAAAAAAAQEVVGAMIAAEVEANEEDDGHSREANSRKGREGHCSKRYNSLQEFRFSAKVMEAVEKSLATDELSVTPASPSEAPYKDQITRRNHVASFLQSSMYQKDQGINLGRISVDDYREKSLSPVPTPRHCDDYHLQNVVDLSLPPRAAEITQEDDPSGPAIASASDRPSGLLARLIEDLGEPGVDLIMFSTAARHLISAGRNEQILPDDEDDDGVCAAVAHCCACSVCD